MLYCYYVHSALTADILVTQQAAGRIFEVASDGEIVWEYVNRYDTKRVAHITQADRYPVGYFDVPSWRCEGNEAAP